MKIKFFLLVFIANSLVATDFLSKDEYQINLYKNPRGIGCDKCHGLDGGEQVFSTYKQKGKTIKVIIPNINEMDFNKFYSVLTRKTSKKNIMPDYFLTDEEISNLYFYLKKTKEK